MVVELPRGNFTPELFAAAPPRSNITSTPTTSSPATSPPPHRNTTHHVIPPQIRSLYRRLLRELPIKSRTTRTAHQKLSAASPLQQRLRQSFQTPTSAAQANPASQEAQVEQFIQYVQAQRMYATLIERYNPGMGMSEEERVRLSARRIGMNLPVEFEGEEHSEGSKGAKE